ncbi:MAG: EthD family reductase [Pseudonocardiaceae bacterium]|nr:EthD family reductase [Pseudonocardiaceae bacterium]
MYRLTVLYGHPDDPAHFDEHYRSVHAPLAGKVGGLTGYTWGKCETADGSKPPYYLVAELRAESKQALQGALETPEGQAAVADLPNFATGGTTMVWDEVQVEVG